MPWDRHVVKVRLISRSEQSESNRIACLQLRAGAGRRKEFLLTGISSPDSDPKRYAVQHAPYSGIAVEFEDGRDSVGTGAQPCT